MPRRTRSARSLSLVPIHRFLPLTIGALLTLALAGPSGVAAQEPAGGAVINGKVADQRGTGLAGAQVSIQGTNIATQTRANGEYVLTRVPPGTHNLQARLLGYRPLVVGVPVRANERITQNFTLQQDPLQLETMVVTGTQSPRMNLDASVAVTTLTATEVQAAAPRSTTEMLRYVPGFTRVESSGGEVNENYTIRGILGIEYVAFLEDGMPVFPTMHTFFMNADNLFRFDTNIDRMEIVRGGSSPLFGSNTPGAIVNFINKSGGDVFGGTMRATGASKGLARYDLNMNGPFGNDWRFNVGGFYRYDHGVRDPGYPGIRGGQLKGNITRLLDNGYLRFSVKHIDDRNQFILPLPLADPANPEFVPGLSDYASMNTPEALDLTVRTPVGTLDLPLDNGLKTKATWFTADASFDLSDDWHLQNTAQVMQDDQEWNALVPSNALSVQNWIEGQPGSGGLGLPAGTTVQLTFTNHFDLATPPNHLPFDTPNGLVAPGELIHVAKPISAIHDQLQLRRQLGPHAISIGGYFANYTQENHWNFTQILTDVENNPKFLDAVVRTPGGTDSALTSNGFRKFFSGYNNGSGQSTIISGVVGAEIQLMERLRADVGARLEYNNFVQSAENTSAFDLDSNPATPFDNETFGNNSFRHFTRGLTDWAASLGLNYRLNENLSIYATGARGYKMPALDEFFNAQAEAQVALFDSREVQSVEGGVKAFVGRLGFTVNGFYTKLKNIVGQGHIIDPITGASAWEIIPSPNQHSFGAEVEAVVTPVEGLQILGSGTVIEAVTESDTTSTGAPLVSKLLAPVPSYIGNLAAIYSPRQAAGFQFKADWHAVGSRYTEDPLRRIAFTKIPSYNYFNFGVGFAIPNAGARINVDLLNAFQSKGLEEGNPRLVSQGGSQIFLARPLLPRRLQASIDYDFGGGGPQR
jgi:outer membrane receptor protein involved in Fe transport